MAIERDEAVRVCRLIAGLVVTDDELDEKEDAFIERMLASFGIPSSDRNEIFPIVDKSEAASALKEMTGELQQQTLDLLIKAAAVDGKIVAEEQAYLDAVADAVGLARDELARRVKAALAGTS
jgi:2-hydroxychromene-2-carboxylate isomerase